MSLSFGALGLRQEQLSLGVEGAPKIQRLGVYQGALVRGLPLASRAWLGGVVVQPARTVLGLRGFEDAFETSVGDHLPLVCFDLEKLIRMALRQSGLALEILGSDLLLIDEAVGWSAPSLIKACFTRQVICHYIDTTRACLRRLGEPGALRLADAHARDALWMGYSDLLVGATLAKEGVLALGLTQQLSFWERLPCHDILAQASSLDVMMLEDEQRAALYAGAQELDRWLKPERAIAMPERVADYDGAQAQLIAARLVDV